MAMGVGVGQGMYEAVGYSHLGMPLGVHAHMNMRANIMDQNNAQWW